jgi:hypothetical protein
MEVVKMTTIAIAPGGWRSAPRRNFRRHYFEMVLAMIVGMAVLGMAVRLLCATAGDADFLQHHPGLRAPVMAANMTIGMSVWMRHRGHGWAPIAEMGAAMFVPLLVLLGPFWAGALSGGLLSGGMHGLMLPAMWIVMLHRRDEYAQDHRHHAAALSAPPATM